MSLVFCLMLLFFFFKLKTAYEMRISDWRSDVCSSDLMDLVKKRKEELGLTNKDIAAALKIDVSAVSKLLSGKRQLKANEAQILADLLKIDAIGSPIIRQIPMIGKASAGAWKEA